jgi:hypothetical protein
MLQTKNQYRFSMKTLLRVIFFFPVLLILFISGSCVKNNPIPAWIEVNAWTLESNPLATEDIGELTHNFSDAWVYVDGKLLGVFELPFKVPVLDWGNKEIKLLPTVRNNGISATKKTYPFVDRYTINVDLVSGETVTINPVTRYYATTKAWIENFETSAIEMDDDPTSMTNFQVENNSSISQWGKYAHVQVNSLDSLWVGYTTGHITLPRGQEVYLEIDYMNSNSLLTGLLAISPSSVVNNTNILLTKQIETPLKWKKIYIDLKELVSYSTEAAYFDISLKALYDSELGNGDVYIDNIKLVYF